MKIKHLVIGLLAMAATVACKREEPLETPELNVDKATVEVAATAGEASFNVTSNQNWVATADADWVSLDPSSGAASEKAVAVKVTAEDNETTAAREATVTVKAGDLTKTVKVKQVAAGETPAPDHSEWALVGTFGEDNNWNPASELYLSVLDEEYFVYYGLELATDSEFKFLKGGAWPPAGQEIGGNGLVEPNTIQPAGGSNIKVTEAGKYDIYLAADLATFYVMSEGKLPSEAVEPAPVENQWGMMGCFVDNQWATDVPMTKEGEWIVAKGAQFTELTFKIRANASWADATNIGRAPGSERAVVNGKIEVVTAEYAKANLGGDAADIKLNGEPGTYDVYFSFENLEVYVMEEGFKPGEKEPQNPDPVEITYTVVGTIADAPWVNNVPAGLMTKEGDLYIAKNVPFVWNSTCYGGNYNIIEFKILETGTWDGFAYPEKNVDQYANAEIKVQIGGENIALNAPEGNYDVYFDKANLKVWVMEPGFKPGEKEPLIPEEVEPVTEGVIWENDGTVGAATWSGSPYRFAKEGMDGLNECCAQIPAAVWEGMKIAPFCVNVKPATAETEWWQIRVLDGWWGEQWPQTNLTDEGGEYDFKPVSEGVVANADGTYTFRVDFGDHAIVPTLDEKHLLFAGDGFIINKMYFGDLPTPGETPTPEPEYTLDGKQWLLNAMGAYVLVDLGLYEEDAMVIALPAMDGSGFACHMYGAYEIEKTDAKSGNIIFTQYDVEFDEFMDPVAYPYSELSESVVYVSMENVLGDATPLPFVAVEEPYEIMFDNLGGGDGPSGAIENGEYWFFNGEKVMAPLAEGVTTGTLPAGNVISGASTEKNIFTLTYDPDWSYYTIQDSYGRYLGQTDETGNITVTDVLPTDDTYAFYLWCVEPGYGEACDIYNAAYYYDLTYSATDNKWVLVDGGYEFPETLPVLVKAENPVEEPVVPEGPKVVTAAEFNAATDNSIEYQVSGTISGIYQAYNSSYNNISLYISDETGEMLAYRLSCAGITDPANTLTKGDLITVKGKRTLYNEKPQMAQGCVIVEHTDVVVETPAGGATLSFADKANRTVFTTSQQVWEQNGVKLINDKGSSTSDVADYAAPARFYKSSKLTVEYAGMTKIEFTCNNGSYATALKSSITTGTVTVNGSVVTVELGAAADSYVISSLSGGQVRMDSLTVYTE